MVKDISYLVISDLHFGNRRTTTAELVKHFKEYFDNFNSTSIFTKVNIIFIAGDLFDGLLDFCVSDIHDVITWFHRLISFCNRHEILLRVLEGTPSHDWHQARIVETLNNILDKSTDVKYIDTLCIEHIKKLDIHVLYVPDEWSSNTDDTFIQVQSLLSGHNLIEVDIAIMHGCFKFQVKNLPGNIQHHKEENYLGIVKYYINIGHFHTYNFNDRIIAQGSLDRLSFGEEEPKGGVICHIGKDNYYTFIENKNAKIYKTIELKGKIKDLDNSLVIIDKIINKYPIDSYVRLKAPINHPIHGGINQIKSLYPLLNISKIITESEEEEYYQTNMDNYKVDFTPIQLTKDNIISLIIEQIKITSSLKYEQLTTLEDCLQQIKEQ